MEFSQRADDYRLAQRERRPEGSCVAVGTGVIIGAQTLAICAGPCAVESEEQIERTAATVARLGANILRGGAFKPRTSPYAFQGLGLRGLEALRASASRHGLAVVTEVLDPRDVDAVVAHADLIQIGARNMQNFALLREVGRTQKPVLLKRGLSATIDEWLAAAEYILLSGNERVILCERGIRSFDSSTRNVLDLAAVPLLAARTHLPVIVDPSHGTGLAALVEPMSLAAIAAGADGVLIEVHPNPEQAVSDGQQSLDFDAFARLLERLGHVATAVGRTLPVKTAAA